MRGEFDGKKGKVEKIDLKKMRIIIAGIFRTKKDGSKVSVYFDPSKLQILELNLDDKQRKAALERKGTKENAREEKIKSEIKNKGAKK